MVFWGAPVASVSISCPSCSATDGWCVTAKAPPDISAYLCSHCRKTWQLQFTYTASQPGTHQKIIDMAMNGVGCRATARIMGVSLNTILHHLKTQAAVRWPRAYNQAVTSSSARKWTNSGAMSKIRQRQRAPAFGRVWQAPEDGCCAYSVNAYGDTGASYELLSPLALVIWMTDGWPLYESRLKESCT